VQFAYENFSLLALVLLVPGVFAASTLYTFNGTYSPYTVNIAFTTSLSGPSLDNVSVANITPRLPNSARPTPLPPAAPPTSA
jgi:hypothetical protein